MLEGKIVKTKFSYLDNDYQYFQEESEKYDLQDRLLKYSIEVIKAVRKFPKGKDYEIIAHQIIKSATSIGANYYEAQGAVSRADFINKVGISLKEVKESYYWTKIIVALEHNNSDWIKILNESNELKLILGRIYSKTSSTIKNG